jgi:hypothetical protein
MYIVGIWMYVKVGIDVERAGDKVLCQCTCIGREERWSLTFIHSRPSPYKMHMEREYYGPNK